MTLMPITCIRFPLPWLMLSLANMRPRLAVYEGASCSLPIRVGLQQPVQVQAWSTEDTVMDLCRGMGYGYEELARCWLIAIV